MILAFIALCALVARLYRSYLSFHSERNPILPCIIEVTRGWYYAGYETLSNGGRWIALTTEDHQHAHTFTSKDDYRKVMDNLRQSDYRQSRWKVVSGRTLEVVR